MPILQRRGQPVFETGGSLTRDGSATGGCETREHIRQAPAIRNRRAIRRQRFGNGREAAFRSDTATRSPSSRPQMERAGPDLPYSAATDNSAVATLLDKSRMRVAPVSAVSVPEA